jgi:hypothetical protein
MKKTSRQIKQPADPRRANGLMDGLCGRSASLVYLSALFGCAALAQNSQTNAVAPPGPSNYPETMSEWPGQGGNSPKFRVEGDYSYVAGGTVSYRGVNGRSDANSFDMLAGAEIPLNDQWFALAGARFEDLWLGSLSGSPIPERIETLIFSAGAGCRIDGQWTVAGSAGPSIYRFDDFGGSDVGFHGMVHAIYQWRTNVSFSFGLAVQPDVDPPVLPLAGLRWDIRPDLTLNLMYPRTALIYRVDRKLNLFLGGGGEFAAFRTESDLGDKIGQSRYNNALGTYRDFHIGVGAEYHLPFGLTASIEGGYSVGRELDYKNIGETVSFRPSPYTQARLRWRF